MATPTRGVQPEGVWLLTQEHHVVVQAGHTDRLPEGAVGASPVWAGGGPNAVLKKVTEELQVKGHSRCCKSQHLSGDPWWPPAALQGGGRL